jgi:hypothetical protein
MASSVRLGDGSCENLRSGLLHFIWMYSTDFGSCPFNGSDNPVPDFAVLDAGCMATINSNVVHVWMYPAVRA